MRVLFQNRPKGSWIGGDMVQLERTMEAVAKLGVDVDFDGNPVHPYPLFYRHYDLIHTFNFSMPWTRYQLAVASVQLKPTVCSMIYHESEEYVPYREQQKMLDSLGAAVFLTEGEKERVKRHLKLDESKARVIPNGIDASWFRPVPVDASEKPFVLTVGRVEPSKGQWAAAKACKAMGIRYVMVGERKDEGYARACEAEGAEWLAPLPQSGLMPLYAACAAFCLPSKAEVFPLTVMEAGAKARPIVLTENCEWDVPEAKRCKWHDPESVGAAIRDAMAGGETLILKNRLKSMTWDDVGKEYMTIYESLL